MNRYDQALLMLLAVALVFAAVIFRIRRARGSSRALATFSGGMGAGMLIAIALLLLFDQFVRLRGGIGLERIVMPIVTVFVSLIGSALLGGLVHLFEGRKPARGLQSMSLDAAAILLNAQQRQSSHREDAKGAPVDDWRAFARHAAGPA